MGDGYGYGYGSGYGYGDGSGYGSELDELRRIGEAAEIIFAGAAVLARLAKEKS